MAEQNNMDPQNATEVEGLCRIVESLVRDCEKYRDEQQAERLRAMEYYDGEMKDTPSDEGRSKVVSRDVRSEIKKILPSIVRIILGGDRVVEYLPVSQDDEGKAEQATDYVNYLALPESDGYSAIHDAIDDSLRLRNGIIKWWQDERTEVRTENHSGLDEMSFTLLAADDDVEVLEHSEVPTQTDQGMVKLHDCKIRRKKKIRKAKLAAIARENFLIHPDAIRIDESPIVGEYSRQRRSDLVAMGYDRKKIDSLPLAGTVNSDDIEEQTRRRDVMTRDELAQRAMQEVDYYDLLVRVDHDNDGIAELRRLVFAGGLQEKYLLKNDEWDELNYADIVCERRPHQWEGNSVTDDVAEIQRIKTVLLRQTLDNIYWQNNQQPTVQEGQIVNPEAVTNPTFGLPIRVKAGVDIRTVLAFNTVPFVADKSFQMLSYLDEEKHDRTGLSDGSAGLPPDALQNVTAKASAMIEQAGIGQTEMMVRTIAQSLKPVFKGLLKLIIQHQDMPRTVRLRGQWVTFDPRTWNADMDVTVNTGLGAGTRERDMMMMSVVTGLQEKIVTALGLGNPLVSMNQIYNGVAKTVEAAGLKSVEQYFTKPTPEAIQQFGQQQAQKPSPEQEKAQGQVMVEKAKGEVQAQLKNVEVQAEMAMADKKMQVETNKEREQRDADLVIKQAELEKETQAAIHQATIDAQANADKLRVEREKIASQERIKLAEIEANIMLERERMDREDARAERQQRADAQNRQFEGAVQ